MTPSAWIGPHHRHCAVYCHTDDSIFADDCCTCAMMVRDEAAREVRERRYAEDAVKAHLDWVASLGTDYLTKAEVMNAVQALDEARARQRYDVADRIRDSLLGHYHVRIEAGRTRSRALVCGGHRIIDYHGWEFTWRPR